MKAFITFLTSAYIIDSMSEGTFGRQPYNVKALTDEIIDLMQGESDIGNVAFEAKDTAMSYVPFLGNVKYGSLPPLFEFGKDVTNAVLGEGAEGQKARNEIMGKWSFNVLMPYGGNQARKTLQGMETTGVANFPFVKDVSKNKFTVRDNLQKVRSWLFGGYVSDEAQKYFEKQDDGGKKDNPYRAKFDLNSIGKGRAIFKLK